MNPKSLDIYYCIMNLKKKSCVTAKINEFFAILLALMS